MNIDVRIQTTDLDGALKTFIKRRLFFSLGRFAGKLGSLRVHIGDVPGARDTTDKACRIRAELLPSRHVLRQELMPRPGESDALLNANSNEARILTRLASLAHRAVPD